MLLIIVLGLIDTLTSVSGECKLGTLKLEDFNWNKFSGPRPWYTLLHNSNDFENSIDCPEVLVSFPDGNKSIISTEIYVIRWNFYWYKSFRSYYGYWVDTASNRNQYHFYIMGGKVVGENRHIKTYGYLTNWNRSGYMEQLHPVPLWNGHGIILAIDYDRYFIYKFCTLKSNKPNVYVTFRSKHPDEATVKEVLKELQDNNIDVSKMVELRADHCQ